MYQLNLALKKILLNVNREQSRLQNVVKTDLVSIIRNFQQHLEQIKKLKNEFQFVVKQKRIKLEKVDRIAKNLIIAEEQKIQLEQSIKVKEEQEKQANRVQTSSVVAKHELEQVPEQLQNMVIKCLTQYSTMVLKDGFLECTCCRDDYGVAGLRSVPNFKIAVNSSLMYSTKRHCTSSETHLTCSRARNKFDARNDFYLKHIQEAKAQSKAMTMNIPRTACFLLENYLYT